MRRPLRILLPALLACACSAGAHLDVHRLVDRPQRDAVAEAEQSGSAWRIHGQRGAGIEGFADRTSVLPGQAVTLRVSTGAPSYDVRAFRMGWYRGREGRQTWRSSRLTGVRQPRPHVIRATNTVVTHWRPSLTIATAGWLPGDYLLRLDGSDGSRAFIPLTVRAPSARGRVVLISPVTTWQAYNRWGCCDLYVGADGSFLTRSRAVSFDRPYLQDRGAGEFIHRELPILAEAERLGLGLDYVTDVDLAEDPALLEGATAVVSMGHDEYWSPEMRAVLTRARDAGANLAFFGANAIYRRIRFAPSPLGPDRIEVNYKLANEDPLAKSDPAQVTADWPAAPHADPESKVTGDMYDCFPVHGAGVVVDPTSWVFAGTNVRRGTRLPHLIGPETDRVQLGYPTPRPLQVLMHSKVWCGRGYSSYADATYYTTSTGAGVFDAGTIDWACAVSGGCGVDASTAAVVRRVTDNLLLAFAQGPAGRSHPAADNLAQLNLGPPLRATPSR